MQGTFVVVCVLTVVAAGAIRAIIAYLLFRGRYAVTEAHFQAF
jgi:hypothetical protein